MDSENRQAQETNLPIITLVGRANVGKSTLFNKLVEEHKALVSIIPGTTRTVNEGDILWRGVYIHTIDTGGIDNLENERFSKEIVEQSEGALKRADIILMVFDAQVGILPQEKELARTLLKKYRATKKIIPVANKIDSKRIENKLHAEEFLSLGLGQPLYISATNGSGVGDLLDYVYKELRKLGKRPKQTNKALTTDVRVSMFGKPNVGKSSLFNKIVGLEKVIVSDIAHTTREPFDTQVEYTEGKKKYTITFVDTAGIRRKAHVSGMLEEQGIKKSIQNIEKSDIILLVLDGSQPFSSQDMQLGGLIERRSKSVIILINKWDLTEDNSDAYRNQVKAMTYAHFPHLDFAPILFVSGKTAYRVQQIFPLIVQIAQARTTEIPTDKLDDFLKRAMKTHRPTKGKGKSIPVIWGIKQINSNPPVFELFLKPRTSVHGSYFKYLEHKLREEFNFLATPIVIKVTKMKK
ncbi:MAG: ribosome biogenesis GTPase Der [Candidatus Magasanikbacteria bacterium]